METITLKYNESVKEKLMKFLESFSKNEISIIEERDAQFEAAKAELHRDYEYSKRPDAVFYTIDEVEEMLEKESEE